MSALYFVLAQAAPPAQSAQQSILSSVGMMVAVFLIFYFLLIRPQQRQASEIRKMQDSLQKGDNIITTGGIHGRIVEVGSKIITLEIADKVKIRMNREGVAAVLKQEVVQDAPDKK